MGGMLSSMILFPAPQSSYTSDHSHLVWIDETHTTQQCKNGKSKRRSPDSLSQGSDNSGKFPALLFASDSGSRHTLLYFHGNSCDLGEIFDELLLLQQYLNCHLLAIEFPGYGVCSGRSTPSAEGIERWGRAGFNWLVDQGVAPASIMLFGRSIGTGPAAKLAANLKEEGIEFAGLTLHSPYISVHQIVSDYDYSRLGRYLIPDFWDVRQCLEVIGPTTPLLIIHGKNDEVVPLYHGETLFQDYSGDSTVKEGFFPEESEHNSYYIIEDLGVPLKAFLRNKSNSRKCAGVELKVSAAFYVIPLEYRSPSQPSTSSLPLPATAACDELVDKRVHHHDGQEPTVVRLLSHKDGVLTPESKRKLRRGEKGSNEKGRGLEKKESPLLSPGIRSDSHGGSEEFEAIHRGQRASVAVAKGRLSRTGMRSDVSTPAATPGGVAFFCSCYPDNRTPTPDDEFRC